MIAFDAETTALLDRAYRGRDFMRRRHANIDALAPRPGERIVDLGCGTGIMVAELAGAVGPGGHVTGIEPSADMRARAGTATAGLPNATLLEGSADALPLDDASQDGIVSVQVFEYISDPAPSLAECRRVLRPGGRLVVGDLHFDTLAWAADDRARRDRVIRAWDAHFADRRTPETLLDHFAGEGFRHRASIPLSITDTGPRPDGMARMMQTLMTGFAVSTGAMTEAEAQGWSDDLDRRAAEGRYFFSMAHIVTVAEAV